MITIYPTSGTAQADHIQIEDFFNKKLSLCTVSDFLDNTQINALLSNLNAELPEKELTIRMDDGCFYPFPYSTIHDRNTFDRYHLYFQSALHFSEHYSDFIEQLQKKLEDFFHIQLQPLITDEGLRFSGFNTRVLFHHKNGIDIHCENAFIPQLNPKLTHWLENKLDLQNALSFYLVLQQPDSGGELILYNQEWDNVQIEIKHESYEDRHDIHGGMFRKKGIKDICYDKISPQKGQAVIFRAAQIWHGIHKIEGNTNRITIGCFIGKGKKGDYYFWA